MLSDNLRLELIINLNGKMLHNTPIFKNFDIKFVSELTFCLRKETFSYGDSIFEVLLIQFQLNNQEGDSGATLYFIVKGSIYLMHKKTQTFIKELQIDDFCGEIAFFSGKQRAATARSKHITECLILDQNDFLQNSINYHSVNEAFWQIHQSNNGSIICFSHKHHQ